MYSLLFERWDASKEVNSCNKYKAKQIKILMIYYLMIIYWIKIYCKNLDNLIKKFFTSKAEDPQNWIPIIFHPISMCNYWFLQIWILMDYNRLQIEKNLLQ